VKFREGAVRREVVVGTAAAERIGTGGGFSPKFQLFAEKTTVPLPGRVHHQKKGSEHAGKKKKDSTLSLSNGCRSGRGDITLYSEVP